MDFSHTPEDEAFRDELRGWLDVQLPKFLADWAATRTRAGAAPRVASRAPRSGARTGSDG